MPERRKPGEKAKESGQYPIIGPRGGETGEERTVVKGEPFPPTPSRVRLMVNPTRQNIN